MNTKAKIINAYTEMVVKRKTANITVTEICEKAGICRKTFYRYFRDRFAIIEDMFISDIEEPLRLVIKLGNKCEICSQIIYQIFLEKKDFYCIVIKEEGMNSLYEDIIDRLVKINYEVLPMQGYKGIELEYIAYKFAATQALLINKWMRRGMKESPEFMAAIYNTDIKGISGNTINDL